MADPVLTLAQMFSPGFPVGAFAYSHGLETAIADGRVRDAAALKAWLTDFLAYGAGASDAQLMRAANLDDAQPFALAVCSSRERVMETMQQGSALAHTAAALWDTPDAQAPYPIAAARIARELGLPEDQTVRVYLQAFLANLVSAAVRAVPLGQTEGQQVLAALTPLIEEVADTATGALDDISSTCFAGDIAAMRHETLEPRIFRT
ncbi:MAG: urease accessory UreF family protein [Pseudomonadota bacterium]